MKCLDLLRFLVKGLLTAYLGKKGSFELAGSRGAKSRLA